MGRRKSAFAALSPVYNNKAEEGIKKCLAHLRLKPGPVPLNITGRRHLTNNSKKSYRKHINGIKWWLHIIGNY